MLFEILGIVTGIFWTIAYLSIIRQGFRDQTFGVPLVALCANLAWEFTFAILFPHRAPQIYINYSWLLLDLVILYQLVRYWRSEFPTWSTSKFWLILSVTLVVCLGLILTITLEFDDFNGMYAAFGQNFMMSVLFIYMLQQRGGLRGQSITIATCKMLGTAASSLGFLVVGAGNGYLLPFLYLTILLFDATYLILVRQKAKAARAFS